VRVCVRACVHVRTQRSCPASPSLRRRKRCASLLPPRHTAHRQGCGDREADQSTAVGSTKHRGGSIPQVTCHQCWRGLRPEFISPQTQRIRKPCLSRTIRSNANRPDTAPPKNCPGLIRCPLSAAHPPRTCGRCRGQPCAASPSSANKATIARQLPL
jgi:hypothetical protein